MKEYSSSAAECWINGKKKEAGCPSLIPVIVLTICLCVYVRFFVTDARIFSNDFILFFSLLKVQMYIPGRRVAGLGHCDLVCQKKKIPVNIEQRRHHYYYFTIAYSVKQVI